MRLRAAHFTGSPAAAALFSLPALTLLGFAGACFDLVGLPLLQQSAHLLRVQQPRQTQVILFLRGTGQSGRAVGRAVVNQRIQLGLRTDGLVGRQLIWLVLLAIGLSQQLIVPAFLVLLRNAEHVVALLFQLGRQVQQHGHTGQEHAGGLALAAGAHEATDCLGEEQRGRSTRGINTHRQAGHVHTLRNHAHRNHPFVLAGGKLLNAVGSTDLIGKDDGNRSAADRRQDLGVGAGGRLIGRDDEAASVRDVVAQLQQASVGSLQDRGDPLPLRVQRRPPRAGGLLRSEGLTQPGLELLARTRTPPRLSGVGHEDHRPDHAVAKRLRVSVGIVRSGFQRTVGARDLDVVHERDLGVIGAERGTGQRQSTLSVSISQAHAVSPALRVTSVVDLVKDHQSLLGGGYLIVLGGLHADLGIGHGHAVVGVIEWRGVGKLSVEGYPHGSGGERPLDLQVLCGNHDNESLDNALLQQH